MYMNSFLFRFVCSILFIYKYCHTSMFAGGLLKATEHDLTSLFMTRMQCIGLAKDGGIQK